MVWDKVDALDPIVRILSGFNATDASITKEAQKQSEVTEQADGLLAALGISDLADESVDSSLKGGKKEAESPNPEAELANRLGVIMADSCANRLDELLSGEFEAKEAESSSYDKTQLFDDALALVLARRGLI